MDLLFEFSGPNQGFNATYNQIYNEIDTKYSEIKKSRFEHFGHCAHPGGRCGVSNMAIINQDNSKTVILSFWDRGMDALHANEWEIGWPGNLNVVHVIGGLGINPAKITDGMPKFTPFLYPLEFMSVYENVEKFRTPYVFEEKIPKACFIGSLYEHREMLAKYLRNRPDLFDMYTHADGFIKEDYFRKMNEYAITLSFNGNGELCMRDFESMGLGIPVVRSEVTTPLLAPLVAEVDYLRGSDPAMDAWFVYGYMKEEYIANQMIDRVEKALQEPEHLTAMSKRNVAYFDEYVYPHKIAQKFFEVFDLDILR
jgi:hypothetical protein